MILPIIVVLCLLTVTPERVVALATGFSVAGERALVGRLGRVMESGHLAVRLRHLPRRRVLGLEAAVALGPRARLLGLSHLDREAAAIGLLIPRCASVHTFGMRFELDLFFLGADGAVLEARRSVPPRRLLWRRGAAAVLELPAWRDWRNPSLGGEFAGPWT